MGRGTALDKFYQRARGDFPAPVPPLTWLRYDGADLSRLLVRAADDGLLEVLGPLLLGARVPMIIHRAGLAAIARPEDEKSNELKAKQANATTPLLADPQTFPVVVPAGAGPGSKIRVKNPQTGADVNVIVPAGVTAGGTFLVPLKPAADENI